MKKQAYCDIIKSTLNIITILKDDKLMWLDNYYQWEKLDNASYNLEEFLNEMEEKGQWKNYNN